MSDAFQVFAVLRFVGAIKASLDGVNEYRLEAYATLLFGVSSDRPRSCGGHAVKPLPRRRTRTRIGFQPVSIRTMSDDFKDSPLGLSFHLRSSVNVLRIRSCDLKFGRARAAESGT
jgi:hypothetical protein